MPDAALLSRIQFAITIMFHYLYPPLSIGLGLLLVIMEGAFLKTKKPLYKQMAVFWSRIFAITFALGVATGVVMEFQFGTNWAPYSRFVGDVFGSPLAAEGIFAFFLESSFLGLMVFGWNRVSPKMHFFATCMVALGAMLSALWIVVANSWMQTPAGYHIVQTPMGPRAEITDFWQMVFNPSSIERLSHVLLGCWQAGAWFVISVSAWYLLKKRHLEFSKAALKAGLLLAVVASLGQLATGHMSAVTVSQYQPAKLAAFEGFFEKEGVANLYLFGWVDEENRLVKYGLGIPGMLNFLVHFDPSKPVKGLGSFPKEEWPPLQLTFQTYHVMIAIGMALIGLSLLAVFLWWRGKLFESVWFLMLLVPAFIMPQIANQVGWIAAEVGRQPWIVYGVLKTVHGVSTNVSAREILASIVMFTSVYSVLFGLFVFLVLEKIKKGPEAL